MKNSADKSVILITGGAGYIGSHTVHQLHEQGRRIIVLDDLSTGVQSAIPNGVELIQGDCGDSELISKLIKKNKIKTVLHFAAKIDVEESILKPIQYYEANFEKSMRLIQQCEKNEVERFLFSSTCAVYGDPALSEVSEQQPTNPKSPYAKTKLMVEWLLQDLEKNNKMRHVILRYFNVAGAKVGGGLGLNSPAATQLIALACKVACGKRVQLQIYGTDYPTPDGTCIRDFIHVDDLANAHILSLKYLERGGKSDVFNCGYGRGYSVLDVVRTVKEVSGVDFSVVFGPRREGDIVTLYSDSKKIKAVLGWVPRYDDLKLICRTAFEWEKEIKNPFGG